MKKVIEQTQNNVKVVKLLGQGDDVLKNALNFINTFAYEDNFLKIGNLKNISIRYLEEKEDLAKQIHSYLLKNDLEIKIERSENECPLYFEIPLLNNKTILSQIFKAEEVENLSKEEQKILEKIPSWFDLFLNYLLLDF